MEHRTRPAAGTLVPAAITIALLLAASPLSIYAQERGLDVLARQALGGGDFDLGRQYAVIIGIDRYAEWPSLRGAAAEAKQVREVLERRYFIDEFVELYDAEATAAAIRKLFAEGLPSKLGLRDSLLVFYAGHGYLDTSKTGFWIASDGTDDVYDQRGWIPNAQLRNMIGALKAQRILVIADACFSGDFLETTRGLSQRIDSAYYRRALGLTARQVLTSGASESVPDASEFGRQLVNLLERNSEPVLDANAMYDRIKLGITKTLPLFGSLPGNEQGAAFALFLRPAEGGPRSAAESGPVGSPVAATPGAASASLTAPGSAPASGAAPGAVPGATPASGAVPSPTLPTAGAMVLVEGGSFTMGSDEGEPDERPAHEVRVSSFFIGKFEVTVGEFREFVDATGYATQAEQGDGATVLADGSMVRKADASWKNGYMAQDERHPVVCVTWRDAIEYCNWRSTREGLERVYTINGSAVGVDLAAKGYRLPTEAEWEYAARGGMSGQRTPYAGSASLGEVAWYASNAGNATHPVGRKAPNELGLYDMSGNAWEWCSDWYAADYYAKSPALDPAGPATGGSRICRGGSWGYAEKLLLVVNRNYLGPDRRYSYLGFRVVRRP
jgi:sulfatase modifying factor 1